MIVEAKGNMFDSESDILVNTVNCEGYMGKGIALEFKYRFPEMFQAYVAACSNKEIYIGRPWVYKESKPMIMCFPTKALFRYPSKIEYIKKGLEYFKKHYTALEINSIAFPLLGAGSGKIDPKKSKEIMLSYFNEIDDLKIEIYEFDNSAPDKKLSEIKNKLRGLTIGELKEELPQLKGKRKETLDRVYECINSEKIINFTQIHLYENFSDDVLRAIYSYNKEPVQMSKQMEIDL